MKQSFRAILQSLLTDADNAFSEIENKLKVPGLSEQEVIVLQQRTLAAVGKRDGIRACLKAWDDFLDSIKQ